MSFVGSATNDSPKTVQRMLLSGRKYARTSPVLFCIFVLLAALCPTVRAQTKVVIDPGQRHQTIEGFGGYMWNWPGHVLSLSPDKQEEVLHLVFDELGISVLRVWVPDQPVEPVNDDDDPYHFVWENFHFEGAGRAMRFAEMARDRGLKLVGSIWTPPPWMKNNKQKARGMLLPEYYEEFAEYMAAIVIGWRERYGLELEAINVQNEPEYIAGYGSCKYTAEQMRDVLKVLGRRFDREGLDTRFMVPETQNPDHALHRHDWGGDEYLQRILEDPEARRYVRSVAVHDYPGSSWYYRRDRAKESYQELADFVRPYGLPIWQTEISDFAWYEPYKGKSGTYLEAIQEVASAIHHGLCYADFSVWLYWVLAGSNKQNESLITIQDGDYQIQPKYYACKHYFKPIQPGYVRIGVDCPAESLLVSAFNSPTGDTVVAVMVNLFHQDRKIAIELTDRSSLPAEWVLTVEGDYWHEMARVDVTRGVTLPQRSISTFWVAAGVPQDTIPPHPPVDLHGEELGSQSVRLVWNVPAPAVDGQQPIRYEINRDGKSLGSTEGTFFEDIGLLPDTEYRYQVVSVNLSGVVSRPAQLTLRTLKDSEPPRLVGVETDGRGLLRLIFDEPLDITSAVMRKRYTVSHPLTIRSVSAFSDSIVQLTLGGVAVGGEYEIYVHGVSDRATPPNTLPHATARFVYSGAQRYLNCGGSAYVDGVGRLWRSDRHYTPGDYGYVGGETVTNRIEINGTEDDEIYQSERYSMPAYRFTLPPGRYRVALHQAEIYDAITGPGQRVFDVVIEDSLVWVDLDIYSEVGFATALVRTFDINVIDGVLDVRFERKVQDPRVSGIAVECLEEWSGIPPKGEADFEAPHPPSGLRMP